MNRRILILTKTREIRLFMIQFSLW